MQNRNLFAFFDKYKSTATTVTEEEEKEIVNQAKVVEQYISADDTFIIVWNRLKNEFVYVSDSVTKMVGYHPSDYMSENGMMFTMSKFHPTHQEPFVSIYEKIWEFYISKNIQGDSDYLSSHNFLYQKSDGSYIQFLQTTNGIRNDKDGMPLISLSVARNVSHLKKNNSMDLAICSPRDKNFWSYNFDLKKMEVVSTLTKQEIKILNLLHTGIESKEVAEICNTSIHTINTHKKNILLKTNCLNTTAAITYCKFVGLL